MLAVHLLQVSLAVAAVFESHVTMDAGHKFSLADPARTENNSGKGEKT